MLTYEGETAIAQMLLQGDNTIVAAGGNWYVGVCNQTPTKDDTLADISTEPSSAGGYARLAIPRNTTGFPTANISVVDGQTRSLSEIVTFSAVGADFDATFTRLFLTNVASGTSGILFGYSGPYSSAIQLYNGDSQDVIYGLFM